MFRKIAVPVPRPSKKIKKNLKISLKYLNTVLIIF